MQGWNDLTDAIWINMLMLVTSLPVVTAGAALCAGCLLYTSDAADE